jgi:hypothetical protein
MSKKSIKKILTQKILANLPQKTPKTQQNKNKNPHFLEEAQTLE